MPFTSYVLRISAFLLVFISGVILASVFFNTAITLIMGAVVLAAFVIAARWIAARREKPVEKYKVSGNTIRRAVTHPHTVETVSGSIVREEDHAMEILDDTQASLMFNQTADGVIAIMHDTLQAHSTFLYLCHDDSGECLPQSFRSESRDFIPEKSFRYGDYAPFHQVIQSKESLVMDLREPGTTPVPYYRTAVPVKHLVIIPLMRKGAVLGLLGVDRITDTALTEQEFDAIKQYGRLILLSIQSIDGVYMKNKLRRLSQSLREFSERLSLAGMETQTTACLKEQIQNTLRFDRMHIWLRHGAEEIRLVEAGGSAAYDKESMVRLDGTMIEKVMTKRRRLYISDVTSIDRTSVNSELELNYLASVVVIPICDQDHCFGVLVIEQGQKNAYDVYEVQFLETVCNSAGLALARIALDQHLSKNANEGERNASTVEQTFMKNVVSEIHRAKRFETSFSVLIFQVDYVKNIYEAFGVEAGDLALEKITEILKNGIRFIDSLARLSHDRFGVLLVESKRKEAVECAGRILHALESAVIHSGDEEIPLTATVGVVTYGTDGTEADALMHRANVALVNAKKLNERRIACAD
ncbi:MAG TPA: diguanylate cyclase [bacterium]|nr:diguanylate cyclase [bacterium]HNH28531.1 diguanylate cyclase [bacterium]HNO90271.1 diguanylate cyclase [bacterium]